MSTATKSKKAVAQAPRKPEKKIGPFHNGLGLAIWLNRVDTDTGPRWFRSITPAPRRYRDAKTGEWKDAASYRPVDLSTLVLALESAKQYVTQTPLPGAPLEGEEYEEVHGTDNGDVPPSPDADRKTYRQTTCHSSDQPTAIIPRAGSDLRTAGSLAASPVRGR
jgi:hypothetical protein